MQTTIIYITGVYDTLDLFTQELKNAFESMGYASFTYDARLEEVSLMQSTSSSWDDSAAVRRLQRSVRQRH